MIKLDLA